MYLNYFTSAYETATFDATNTHFQNDIGGYFSWNGQFKGFSKSTTVKVFTDQKLQNVDETTPFKQVIKSQNDCNIHSGLGVQSTIILNNNPTVVFLVTR